MSTTSMTTSAASTVVASENGTAILSDDVDIELSHTERTPGQAAEERLNATLERFFALHSNFFWDRAKEYIENERDIQRTIATTSAGTSPVVAPASTILVTMMSTLAQLTTADRNYLTLQFFSSTNKFLTPRKDSKVKCDYEKLRLHLVELERQADWSSYIGVGSAGSGRNSSSMPVTPSHAQQHYLLQQRQQQLMQLLDDSRLMMGVEEEAVDVLECELFNGSTKSSLKTTEFELDDQASLNQSTLSTSITGQNINSYEDRKYRDHETSMSAPNTECKKMQSEPWTIQEGKQFKQPPLTTPPPPMNTPATLSSSAMNSMPTPRSQSFLSKLKLFRFSSGKSTNSSLTANSSISLNQFPQCSSVTSSVVTPFSTSEGGDSEKPCSPQNESSTTIAGSRFDANCDVRPNSPYDVSPPMTEHQSCRSMRHDSQPQTRQQDTVDKLAAHYCGQLAQYIRVRLEMIDLYEKLSICYAEHKFCLVDDCLRQLIEIHRQAEQSFFNPVMSSLKSMFMLECDILLSLLTAHQKLQEWKFLDSLFPLQDAHNKLNFLVSQHDKALLQVNGVTVYTPHSAKVSGSNVKSTSNIRASVANLSPGPLGPIETTTMTNITSGSNTTLRRNITSSSLSSSSSSGISASTVLPGPYNNGIHIFGNTSGGVSPNLQTQNYFNYSPSALGPASGVGGNGSGSGGASTPTGSTTSSLSSINAVTRFFGRHKDSHHHNNVASGNQVIPQTNQLTADKLPLLIQWLNEYKLFLMSKYTFYFRSLLVVHLTPLSVTSCSTSALASPNSVGSISMSSVANYAAIESQMRTMCSKHVFDFHNRISQFVKKFDSSYVVMMYDTHERADFSIAGYRSPFLRKEKTPKGINSFPIIYSYPGEFPKMRIPSLIMIVNDKIAQLTTEDKPIVVQDRLSGIEKKNATQTQQQHQGYNDRRTSVSVTQLAISLATGSSNSTSTNAPSNTIYFMIRPDPDITLVMICDQTKKALVERDANSINNFLSETAQLLKGKSPFTSLRKSALTRTRN